MTDLPLRIQRKAHVLSRAVREARGPINRDALRGAVHSAMGRTAQFDWSIAKPVQDDGEGLPIRDRAPREAAVDFVKAVFSNFKGVPPFVSPAGIYREGRVSSASPHRIDQGTIVVQADFRDPTTGNQESCEVPVIVRKGKMLQPSVIFWRNVAHIMCQDTIDSIWKRSSLNAGACRGGHRADLSLVASHVDGLKLPVRAGQIVYMMLHDGTPVPYRIVNAETRDLVSGGGIAHETHVKIAPVDRPNDSGWYPVNALWAQPPGDEETLSRLRIASVDHLDPAERDVDSIHVGQTHKLINDYDFRDRGGACYLLAKGTPMRIERDRFGDGSEYVVLVDERGPYPCGSIITVPRAFLVKNPVRSSPRDGFRSFDIYPEGTKHSNPKNFDEYAVNTSKQIPSSQRTGQRTAAIIGTGGGHSAIYEKGDGLFALITDDNGHAPKPGAPNVAVGIYRGEFEDGGEEQIAFEEFGDLQQALSWAREQLGQRTAQHATRSESEEDGNVWLDQDEMRESNTTRSTILDPGNIKSNFVTNQHTELPPFAYPQVG